MKNATQAPCRKRPAGDDALLREIASAVLRRMANLQMQCKSDLPVANGPTLASEKLVAGASRGNEQRRSQRPRRNWASRCPCSPRRKASDGKLTTWQSTKG